MLELKKLKSQIKQLKDNLNNDLQSEGTTDAQVKKATTKIRFLSNIADYLETKPSDDFIKSEIERLRKRHELINEGFNGWLPVREFNNEKEKLKFYNKENGLPKLKTQLKTLRFILNK